jgi:hypothetical protein
LRNCGDEQAFEAVCGHDDFDIFAAFEGCFKTVQAQSALLPLFTVAANAGRFKELAEVGGVGDALFVSGGREFAKVELGDIPFVIGPERRNGQGHHSEENERGGNLHIFTFGHLLISFLCLYSIYSQPGGI